MSAFEASRSAALYVSPAGNVVREVEKEFGFLTAAAKILTVLDRSKHPPERT